MTHHSNSSFGFLAIAMFAVLGIFGAGPVADLVDCSDGFWAVACSDGETSINPALTTVGSANAEPGTDEVPAGEEARRIDNDPVCTQLESGDFFCHS